MRLYLLALLALPAVASGQVRYVAPQPTINPSQHGGCEPKGISNTYSAACMKSEKARQKYLLGQTLPASARYTSFGQIPYGVRRALKLERTGSYVYEGQYLYTINPETRRVANVMQLVEK